MTDPTTEPSVSLLRKQEPRTIEAATEELIERAQRYIPPGQRGAFSVQVNTTGAEAVIAIRAARLDAVTLDVVGYVDGTWRGHVDGGVGAKLSWGRESPR